MRGMGKHIDHPKMVQLKSACTQDVRVPSQRLWITGHVNYFVARAGNELLANQFRSGPRWIQKRFIDLGQNKRCAFRLVEVRDLKGDIAQTIELGIANGSVNTGSGCFKTNHASGPLCDRQGEITNPAKGI
jgi:hypothetical protein